MKPNTSKKEAAAKLKRFVRRHIPNAKCVKRRPHWYLIFDKSGHYRGDGRTADDAWICAADHTIIILKCLSLLP